MMNDDSTNERSILISHSRQIDGSRKNMDVHQIVNDPTLDVSFVTVHQNFGT